VILPLNPVGSGAGYKGKEARRLPTIKPLANLARPPVFATSGALVFSSVAIVATSCRCVRSSGWASATRCWHAGVGQAEPSAADWAVPPWLLLPLGEDPLLRTCKSPGEHGEEKSEAHSCSELRTSVALLENIGRFLLAITENIRLSARII